MSYMSFCNFNSKSDGRRYDFFSFNYSSSLSTSDSFECFFDPQRSFGNPLRALFLKNRDFFWYCEIFLPNTRGPLGCLLGFWLSRPKPCRGNKLLILLFSYWNIKVELSVSKHIIHEEELILTVLYGMEKTKQNEMQKSEIENRE